MEQPLKKETGTHEGIYEEVWQYTKRNKGLEGCIIHGLGEYSGRYEECIRTLLKDSRFKSIVVWDHWGHGRSQGKRGDARKGIDTLIQHSGQILKRYPNVDWIWGHSLGGIVVLGMLEAARYIPPALKAVVLTSSPFVLGQEPTAFQKFILPCASMLVPQLALSSSIRSEQISSLKQEQKKYEEEPLIHDRVSVRMYRSLMEHIYDYPTRILDLLRKMRELRLMLAYGAEDAIALPRALKAIEEATQGDAEVRSRITFRLYKHARHEIHHDKDRDLFLKDMIAWVAQKERP